MANQSVSFTMGSLPLTTAIFANPGQKVTLAVQVLDGYGARTDGYIPSVNNIYFPNLSTAAGFPIVMTRIETGLYVYQLTIPAGAASVGTFLANVKFLDPSTGYTIWQLFQINVALPFGNSSVSPF
jgi:hypothetical protein